MNSGEKRRQLVGGCSAFRGQTSTPALSFSAASEKSRQKIVDNNDAPRTEERRRTNHRNRFRHPHQLTVESVCVRTIGIVGGSAILHFIAAGGGIWSEDDDDHGVTWRSIGPEMTE